MRTLKRYKFTALAIIGVLLLIWGVGFLLKLDEEACAAKGGDLHIKSAGKGIVELCISPDGRFIE